MLLQHLEYGLSELAQEALPQVSLNSSIIAFLMNLGSLQSFSLLRLIQPRTSTHESPQVSG